MVFTLLANLKEYGTSISDYIYFLIFKSKNLKSPHTIVKFVILFLRLNKVKDSNKNWGSYLRIFCV